MRSAGNFHPEWGYFAPMPRFRRSLRVAAIAAAIGATAGAAVVVSLVNPPRSKIYNTSFSAHALISRTQLVASPANALTRTITAADETAPAGHASLALNPARSIEIIPVANLSTMLPTAAVNPEPDTISANKSPARTRWSRVAKLTKHPRHERAFVHPFQLPQNSRLVAWTSSPARRSVVGW